LSPKVLKTIIKPEVHIYHQMNLEDKEKLLVDKIHAHIIMCWVFMCLVTSIYMHIEQLTKQGN